MIAIQTPDQNNISAIHPSDIKVFDPSMQDASGNMQELTKDHYPLDISLDISIGATTKIDNKDIGLSVTNTVPLRLTCESLSTEGKKQAIQSEFQDTSTSTTYDTMKTLLEKSISTDTTSASHFSQATERFFGTETIKGVFEKEKMMTFVSQHLLKNPSSDDLISRIINLLTTSDATDNPLLMSATKDSHTLDNLLSHAGIALDGYTG